MKRFRTDRSVPHIGWNGLNIKKPSRIFNRLRGDEKFYFVHSYHVAPDDPDCVLTTTDYGYEFVSGIQTGNVIATQFHPEKSGDAGLAVLEDFLKSSDERMPPALSSGGTRLAKRIVACLDVRTNDDGDLVVTKGDRYDVREKTTERAVRNLGRPVDLAREYYRNGADEITFLNITGFRDFPLEDLPMIEVLQQTSKNVFVPLPSEAASGTTPTRTAGATPPLRSRRSIFAPGPTRSLLEATRCSSLKRTSPPAERQARAP